MNCEAVWISSPPSSLKVGRYWTLYQCLLCLPTWKAQRVPFVCGLFWANRRRFLSKIRIVTFPIAGT